MASCREAADAGGVRMTMENAFSVPKQTSPTHSWTGPLFIIGMPRSGTKLLRGLLGQHPRIRIPTIETDFLPFLVRWVREHGQPEQPEAFAALFQELRRAPYFMLRAGGAAAFEWREWREHCGGRYDAASLFEGFVRYETGTGAQTDGIWGDKSPAYMRHVGALLEHFPHARVVHIVRDVRDYCISVNRTWRKDMRRAAHEWARDVERVHRTCRSQPGRCIEVSYEDLLRSPEAVLRRLTTFLRIEPADASMLSLARPVEARGDAAGRTEIMRDNFSKFADRLTPRQIRAIEALAFDTMQLVGYRPLHAARQQHLGAFEQRMLRLKDGASLLAHSARTQGLAGALRFHLGHARLVG
jgi:sulfotransferase family protein